MPLHLLVNTWNRPELATRVLDRIARLKSPDTKVTVIPDAGGVLPQIPEGFSCYPEPTGNLGCAKARRYAMGVGATFGDDHLMFLDDDMFVMPGFDVVPLELWLKYRHRHPGCYGTAYRANDYGHLEREIYHQDYILRTSLSGCCIVMDTQQAGWCARIYDEMWDSFWDWNLSGRIIGAITPYRTLMYHVGVDKSSAHGSVGYDFDYFLQRQVSPPG